MSSGMRSPILISLLCGTWETRMSFRTISLMMWLSSAVSRMDRGGMSSLSCEGLWATTALTSKQIAPAIANTSRFMAGKPSVLIVTQADILGLKFLLARVVAKDGRRFTDMTTIGWDGWMKAAG